jgi:type VI secretion system protein ImpG
MDQRLLTYYNRELSYLRELGGEFAKQFPKIAGRIGLSSFECADPYVERLLEGFAFLAARVQLKIDAEFPRFTEHLLSMVYPHYLAPTPSMAVVRFEPNYRQGSLVDGVTIPRGTALHAQLIRGEQTACEYRTAHDVTLWPIELVSVAHTAHVGDLGELRLPSRRTARGALRLRFRTHAGARAGQLRMTSLPLFLTGPDRLPAELYELLCAGALGVLVRSPQEPHGRWVTEEPVRGIGFDDEEALLPASAKFFQGYRLLHEYFALPARYSFVELRGLGPALAGLDSDEFEIVVVLDRYVPNVEAAVTAAHFEPFCSPAVNLFPRRADRIHLSDRVNQYHVVIDRTRPMDFELHSIAHAHGFGTSAEQRREFRSFYARTDRDGAEADAAYYTLHREPRLSSARQRRTGGRSSYAGSEAFVALVNGEQGPFHADMRQLAIEALCTNRDLPLLMPLGQGSSDFSVESGAPVASVRCVAGPSEPRPPIAWGSTSWRLVSHLCSGQLSLLDNPEGQGAAGLRELLSLYSEGAAPALRRQIEGVTALSTASIVHRLPTTEQASFGRGLEVTLHCDEGTFEGSSAFLLSAVLDRFFARYVAINSFTQTVLRTAQRGEVVRFPARIGRRALG